MIHIEIYDENKVTRAQQLGHHQNLQDTIEKAVEMYIHRSYAVEDIEV